jgi:hypothetical protein
MRRSNRARTNRRTKRRSRKVSTRKTNYRRKNYRRKTRKKLHGGMLKALMGDTGGSDGSEQGEIYKGPTVFAVDTGITYNGKRYFKEYSPADNHKIYQAVGNHYYGSSHPAVNVTRPQLSSVSEKPRFAEDLAPPKKRWERRKYTVISGPEECSVFFGEKAKTLAKQGKYGFIDKIGAIPMIQISNGIEIKQIRIARHRNEDEAENVKTICYKKKPTAGSWETRYMKLANQSLLFYDSEAKSKDDTTARGSSITDLTGSTITRNMTKFTDAPITGFHTLTITPNPILNPSDTWTLSSMFGSSDVQEPFWVEKHNSNETYKGQNKLVSLDEDGKVEIAFPDVKGGGGHTSDHMANAVQETIENITGNALAIPEPMMEPEPEPTMEPEPEPDDGFGVAPRAAEYMMALGNLESEPVLEPEPE